MNKFKYILFVLIASLLFVGCDDEDGISFSNSEAFVKFQNSTASCAETGDILKVVVNVSDLNRSGDITVDFDFNATGISNKATVGEDFKVMNSSQTLTFKKGQYQDTIFIKTIDNDVYEKDKTFNIVLKSNSADYKLGLANSTIGTTVACTIVDNEHPLALILGKYTEADYLMKDGSLQASYNIELSADPEDETKVKIDGFWEGGQILYAVVDIANKTLEIPAGQLLYVSEKHGDCFMVAMDMKEVAYPDAPIKGSIDADGNIIIDPWAALVKAGAFGTYEKSILTKK